MSTAAVVYVVTAGKYDESEVLSVHATEAGARAAVAATVAGASDATAGEPSCVVVQWVLPRRGWVSIERHEVQA